MAGVGEKGGEREREREREGEGEREREGERFYLKVAEVFYSGGCCVECTYLELWLHCYYSQESDMLVMGKGLVFVSLKKILKLKLIIKN